MFIVSDEDLGWWKLGIGNTLLTFSMFCYIFKVLHFFGVTNIYHAVLTIHHIILISQVTFHQVGAVGSGFCLTLSRTVSKLRLLLSLLNLFLLGTLLLKTY